MSGLYVGSGLLRASMFEPLFRWLAQRRHAGGRVSWLRVWALALIAEFAYFISTAIPTLWLQRLVGNQWLSLLLFIALSTAVPMVWRRLRRSMT